MKHYTLYIYMSIGFVKGNPYRRSVVTLTAQNYIYTDSPTLYIQVYLRYMYTYKAIYTKKIEEKFCI